MSGNVQAGDVARLTVSAEKRCRESHPDRWASVLIGADRACLPCLNLTAQAAATDQVPLWDESSDVEPVLLHDGPLGAVWCGDARKVLPSIPTESLALTVTDPPYGVEWQSGFRTESFERLANDGAGDREVVREVVTHCVRLVGQNRHLYVFGPTDVLDGLKVSAITPLIWDKATLGSGDLAAVWSPAHEPISFMTSKHRHAGQSGKEGLPNRLRKGSVLRFPRPTGRKVRHPSEKPVALLRELIESSSRQGETVLDPFAGVGSTGVAAILSGRRALLVELDRKYAEITVERVRRAEEIAALGGVA